MAELVDHLGNPIDTRALREERAGATLTGARSIWPTYNVRSMTPGRMAAVLRQAEVPGHGNIEYYMELAEHMEELDLHYAGDLQTRKLQVSQIPVIIEPASDGPDEVRDAELVSEFFERETLADELRDVLDAIGKGFSVTEIVWDMSERQWMPQRLEYRLPRWFDFDQTSGRRLMLRDSEGGWLALEETPYKYITATISAKSGLPIRGGLARIAAWAWLFKNYTLRDWVRFAEAYGQPLRIGKFSPGATQDDKNTLLRAVRDIAADAAAIIPQGMDIQFEDGITFQGRSEVYLELLRYIDSQISIAVLGQTLTTQPGESGSYSLGQVHNEVRKDIEMSDARRLAEVLQRDLVIPIVTLNHGPRKRYPKVCIARSDPVDIKLLSESLEKLVPMGLKVREDEVRTLLNLSAPEDDDEILMPPTAATEDDSRDDYGGAPGDDPEYDPEHDPDDEPADDADDDDPAMARALPTAPGTVPLLVRNLSGQVGPLVDGWADVVRSELMQSEALSGFRRWLMRRAAAAIDTGPLENVLGEALTAAWLAGRYDVAIAPVAEGGTARGADLTALAAEPSADSARLPFSDQISFFRRKVNVGTRAWTDLWQEQHDVAFVVAGAARDGLLSDLRGAVDSAIAEGTTLETFRQRFDGIVARYGWSYNGGRDWRTRVIYDTNLRTSHAAGRWAQLQAVKGRRPYWRYRHSGSENPRLHHKRWDGMALHADDPWWRTNYPPNGWGCGCYVDALSARDLERLGKDGPDRAPALDLRQVTVGIRGPSPRTVRVPRGVDPGFAYAPGRDSQLGNAAQVRLLQGITQSPHMAATGMRGILDKPEVMRAHLGAWEQWRKEKGPRGRQAEAFVLGAMDGETQDWLAARQAVTVASAAITITRKELQHARRPTKRGRGQALDEADWRQLPALLHRPDAILYDRQKKNLLYVFAPDRDARTGKVVIRTNYSERIRLKGRRRETITTNSVRTAGYVQADNLRGPDYELIRGEMEHE